MSESNVRPMRCGACGAEMTVAPGTTFYPESGLDNVQLIDIPVWTCPLGHQEAEIPDVDQLHHTLAELVVRKRASLRAAEISFLRKAIGMTAREFSSRIGLSPEHLSRIEHGRQVPPRSLDLLIRLYCACTLAATAHRSLPTDILQALEQLEQLGAGSASDAHRLMYGEPADSGAESAGSTWHEATA